MARDTWSRRGGVRRILCLEYAARKIAPFNFNFTILIISLIKT